jgi:hypothetical protein
LGSSYASIESDRGSGGRPAIEVPNGAPAVRGASVGRGWKIQTFRRIRLCIRRLRAPDNRRFRLVSISARNVQPSGSRRAVIKRPRLRTHSCLKIRGSWVRNPRGAARARGVPFRFGPRDGDAFVGRHPARRETHCARWRGWGFVAKETGERSRMRMRSLDRSVGRSPSSEYACRFRQMRIRAARKTPTNGTLSEDPRRRRRRRREPSDVFAVGVMAARGVDPVTTPAPRGTSVAKR